MSFELLKNLRDNLTSETSVTDQVDSSNIRVGWQTEIAEFPTISIFQTGGSQVGQMSYNVAPSGLVREEFSPQIEVYSRKSLKETYSIQDALDDVLISSGYAKESDNDLWDDDLSAHRKVSRWSKIHYFEQ